MTLRYFLQCGKIGIFVFYLTPIIFAQSWQDKAILADSLFIANDFDSAIIEGKLALQELENDSGHNDSTLATLLCRLGTYQEKADKLKEAEVSLKRSLSIGEQTFGINHLNIATTLYELSYVYLRQGMYSQAESLCQRSLDIRKNNLPANHGDLATNLCALAYINSFLGNNSEARELGEQALGIWQLQQSPQVVKAHLALGTISSQIGLLEESEFHYKKAAEISRDVYGRADPTTANALTGLANIYFSKGKLANAEQLYQRILDIFQEANGSEHTDVARILINLALVYENKGMYGESKRYYEKAASIMEKIHGPKHVGYARALEGIASSYFLQGKYSLADSVLLQVLNILENALGADNFRITFTLKSLSDANLELGRVTKAIEYESRAIQIIENRFGSEHPYLSSHLIQLGKIRSYQGNFEEAESYYLRALEIIEDTFDEFHPEMAECLELLSDSYRRWGQTEKCLDAALRAVAVRKQNLQEFVEVLAEKDALIYSHKLRNSVSYYLSSYTTLELEDRENREHVADVILSTKGKISDAMFERRKRVTRLVQAAESLRYAKFQKSQLYVHGVTGDPDKYTEKLDSLTELIDDLQTELAYGGNYQSHEDYIRDINSERVARLLPSNSVLIEYLQFDFIEPKFRNPSPDYVAVVISKDESPMIVDLGSASDIDQIIDRYRQHVLSVAGSGRLPTFKDLEGYQSISMELYKRIIKPIEKQIEDVGQIFVAPDGGLNLISFAGLAGDNGKYMIEEYSIHNLSSGRDIVRLNERDASGRGLFALGDPDYDASVSARLDRQSAPDSDSFRVNYYATIRGPEIGCRALKDIIVKPLPGTRAEIDQIEKSWKQSSNEPINAYFGSMASEETFKRIAPGKRVVHLATHGYFFEGVCQSDAVSSDFSSDISYAGDNPLLLSGLFFAGANLHGEGSEIKGAEDGVLTAYEVTELPFVGTELIVLSACETGLGDVKEGEGVYGLRRAFQMAGARTVVSALWPVSDKQTATMMSELYKETNETLAVKMRRIQLSRINELRKSGFADHPFNWGGFIAVGDWR